MSDAIWLYRIDVYGTSRCTIDSAFAKVGDEDEVDKVDVEVASDAELISSSP